MNLRRLEYFLAVVQHGTVTRAAQELHLAQPALSRQLKTLQRELRVDLFEPAGAGLTLTPAGRAFVPHARRLVSEATRVTHTVSNIRLGAVGVLEVATTLASARGFVAPFVATTTAQDPTLVVQVAGHYALAARLAGDTDMIITPQTPTPNLHSLELSRFPIWLHVSPDHEWAQAGRTEVGIKELAGQELALPSPQSVSRSLLDMSALEFGVGIEPRYETDDGISIQALAAAGRAVGITTEFGEFNTHTLKIALPRRHGTLALPVHAAWRADHYAAATLQDLAHRIKRFANTRPPVTRP